MDRRENRVVFIATATHMLTHAYMMIFPTVLVLLARDPGLSTNSYFRLGLVGTLCYGLFGAGAIPAGMLADRLGSQRMLAVCAFFMALASLAAGLSPSLLPFVASMALLGLAASIYHPSGLSFISRNVRVRGRAMGIHGVGGNVGLALGPVLSGAAAARWGWRGAFIVFAVLGFVLFLLIVWTRIERHVPKASKTKTPARGKGLFGMPFVLLLIYFNSMLYGLCYRGSMMFFPKHFVQNIHFALDNVARAGTLVAFVTLAGTVGQLLGGILCDKLKRPEHAYLLVFLASTPLFFSIWLLKNWLLFAASLAFAMFFFAWQPVQNTLIAKYAARSAHGLSFGINFLLIMGVGAIAASVGGYVTDLIGVAGVFAVLGTISTVSLLVVIYMLWYIRKQEA